MGAGCRCQAVLAWLMHSKAAQTFGADLKHSAMAGTRCYTNLKPGLQWSSGSPCIASLFAFLSRSRGFQRLPVQAHTADFRQHSPFAVENSP